jgi:hypothetical protein
MRVTICVESGHRSQWPRYHRAQRNLETTTRWIRLKEQRDM